MSVGPPRNRPDWVVRFPQNFMVERGAEWFPRLEEALIETHAWVEYGNEPNSDHFIISGWYGEDPEASALAIKPFLTTFDQWRRRHP